MIRYKNRAYTRCPIPNYDIRGTELWLEKMAAEGYILRKDGFTGEFASFDITSPTKLRYRLDAAPHGTRLFSPGDGEPDPEQVELSRELGWEYIAKRSDFFIYVSADNGAAEFHTDPQVRAMALKAVRNRFVDAFVSNLFNLLLLPLGAWRFGLMTLMIGLRTWFVLLWLVMVILDIIHSARKVTGLMKVRRQIMEEGFAEAYTDINKKGTLRHLWDFVRIALPIFIVCVILSYWSDSLLGTHEIPIEEYRGNIPFATMADMLPEGKHRFADYDFGNTVETWQDIISPVNIVWDEISEVTEPDGTRLDGGLDVYYHETLSPFVANNLAKEFHRRDKREKRYSEFENELSFPELDYFAVYSDELHFPVVIMQKGNIVLRARLYQTGTSKMPLEEWAEIMYNSVFGS